MRRRPTGRRLEGWLASVEVQRVRVSELLPPGPLVAELLTLPPGPELAPDVVAAPPEGASARPVLSRGPSYVFEV